MSIIATGTAIVTQGGTIVNKVGDLLGLGGSSCSSQQKEAKRQLAGQIDSLLTRSEKVNLIQGMESDVQPTGASMADFYYGGRDCKHKNVSSGDQRFLDRLPAVLTRKAQQKEASQAQQPTGDVSSNFDPDETPQAYNQQQRNGTGRKPNYMVLAGMALVGYLIFNS